jgi:hypothetical protein
MTGFLFNLRGPAGNLILDADETFTRIVHSQRVVWNYTGTISVPDFDDTRGMFYPSYYAKKFRFDINVQQADAESWNSDYMNRPGFTGG